MKRAIFILLAGVFQYIIRRVNQSGISIFLKRGLRISALVEKTDVFYLSPLPNQYILYQPSLKEWNSLTLGIGKIQVNFITIFFSGAMPRVKGYKFGSQYVLRVNPL